VTIDASRHTSRVRAMPYCAPGAVGVRLEASAGRSAPTRVPSVGENGSDDRSPKLADRRRLQPGLRLPVAEGFELDLAARELRHAGVPVHLRPREFQLLATLAADPGRAFTRRQLMDLAWEPELHVDPRTVDVHVHWLRSKIEATPARPTHLVTIRGFGYRLDPTPR
jgi:DNA-binding response OmpR family regulator